LLERYDVSDEVSEKSKGIIQMRVCVVVKRWVELFNDERETQLIGQLSDFIDEQIDDGCVSHALLSCRLVSIAETDSSPSSPPPSPSSFPTLDPRSLEASERP